MIAGQRVCQKGPAVLLRECARPEGGVEICEDLWSPFPSGEPGLQRGYAARNPPDRSDETISAADNRREPSARASTWAVAVRPCTDSGLGESTTDMVFAGHDLIA